MNKQVASILFIILINALLGCAGKRDLVVLLPNSDGSVGSIYISNPEGSITLDQAGEASILRTIQDPPGTPFIIDQTKIATIFGPAIKAQPQPPVHFILYFEYNSTKLSEHSLALLPKILKTTKARHSVDTSIIGHTDTAGDKQYNLNLSKRRAVVVGEVLVQMGIDQQILEITSHGEKNLLIQTDDNVPEARNRRVEVTIR